MIDNFWTILFYITTFQTIFLVVVLFFFRNRTKSTEWLSLLLFAFLLLQLETVVRNTILLYSLPHLFSIHYPIYYIIGPILYFYVSFIVVKDRKFHLFELLHFVPFVLSIAYNIDFYLSSAEYKVSYMEYFLEGNPTNISLLHLSIRVTLNLFYVGYVLWIMRVNSYNDFYSINPNLIVYTIGITWITYAFSILSMHYFSEYVIWLSYMRIAGFAILSYVLTFVLLKQTVKSVRSGGGKYLKSKLSSKELKKYSTKVITTLHDDSLFKDPNLNQRMLADKIGISSNKLSQILNEELEVNFYQIVNRMRVEDFKKRLASSDMKKYTIMGLAGESGFRSKASMLRNFKVYAGTTPSQYLQAITKIAC